MDDDLHFGNGFSLEAAKNDAAANALLKLTTSQEKIDNKTAFYTLKEKRKGLIFQSIRKKNGLFDVTVQVKIVYKCLKVNRTIHIMSNYSISNVTKNVTDRDP